MRAIRSITAALAFLLTPPLVMAQYSPQFTLCAKNTKTQRDINVCASNELARTEKLLERTYSQLLARVAKQPLARGKIEASEKMWARYREAYIEAAFPLKDKQREYGTLYRSEVDLMRAKLNLEHASDLNDILQRYTWR